MTIETTTNQATRRTYTQATCGTPAGEQAAQRAALKLALTSGPGWEHGAPHCIGKLVYVTDQDGIVRLEKSDEGCTMSWRRIK